MFRNPIASNTDPDELQDRRATMMGLLMAAPFTVIGFLLGSMLGFDGWQVIAFALCCAGITALFVKHISLFWANMASGAVKHALMPSGNSTPYQKQFSYQEAMAMRGDVAGALESFEALIQESPGDVEVRLRTADLYLSSKHNPRRAAELLKEVQGMEQVQPHQYVYAANRLVDLYLGALHEEGRALVELRKLVERYPGSPVAAQAREAIANLKAKQAAAAEQT